MNPFAHTLLAAVAAASLALSAGTASAQTTLDHAKAMAGIDADDTPGYPILISKPGSYVLTGNLTVPSNMSAIFVYASDVTIDLNGFTISGAVGCSLLATGTTCNNVPNSVADGITTTVASNVTVRNGTVQGFDRAGIRLAYGGAVSDVSVRSNGSHGLLLGVNGNPAQFQVDRVTADRNGGAGIYTASGGRFSDIVARYNGSHGLYSSAGSWSTLGTNLLALVNGGYGAVGSTLRGSVLSSNKAGTTSSISSLGANMGNGAPF